MELAMQILYREMVAVHELGDDAWQAFQVERFEQIRQNLLQVMGLTELPGIEVALAASGTDCEFLATALALSVAKGPLCNIIAGAMEVGSGTAFAATGRHFTDMPPFAKKRQAHLKGSGIAGFAHIADDQISFRHADGTCLSSAEIDAETIRCVVNHVCRGEHVLLHVNASSKTGIFAPSLTCVKALAKAWPGQLTVVVDAAQGRFSRQALRDWLALGWQVLLTGSKFFGGPSFSGALLIPANFSAQPRLINGLSGYFCRGELPRSWQSWQRGLPRHIGAGRLLRWEAALSCMKRYYALPSPVRHDIMARFSRIACDSLGESTMTELWLPPSGLMDGAQIPYCGIIPFIVYRSHDAKRRRQRQDCMDSSQLKIMHERLGSASCDHLPASSTLTERESLRVRFHLGQPVILGQAEQSACAVLRVALGAPLLIRLATDTALGADLDARSGWLQQQFRLLVKKMDTLARYCPTGS